MKRTVLAVGLATLGGCAAVPPMYPVFEAASDTRASSPFVMREMVDEDRKNAAGEVVNGQDGKPLKDKRPVQISDLPKTITKLYEQRAAYQNQADRAQKALYQTGDGVMVGAVVGAVGGLISNVATAASGAGIATVSGLAGSRYDLAAQRNIYNDGARRVSCMITAASGFSGELRQLGGASLDADKVEQGRMSVANTLQQGADDVLAVVRGQLGQLSPPAINAAAVIALYNGLLPAPDLASGARALTGDQAQKALDSIVANAQTQIKACAASGEPVPAKK